MFLNFFNREFYLNIILVYGCYMRKKIRILVYYILPAVLFLLSIFSEDIYPLFGQIALYVLLIIMFVKPLAVLIKFRIFALLLGYRREMGYISFWFFLFHAGGLIWSRNLRDINYFLGINNALFWGALAATGMVILTLTANNFSVKFLKKKWKTVQSVAYLVLFFALMHANIMTGRGVVSAFAVFGVYLLLKILQYKKTKKKVV